jgi:para-nitrobenzyl esterase
MENEFIKTTLSGPVRGLMENGVETFLGIPFAKAERFAYAQPVDAWEGTLDATRFGPACPQYRAWFPHLDNPERLFYFREFREGLDFVYDENCLNLNIYAPEQAENCPVILYFYGGGFNSGCNAEEPFRGYGLAKRGIVTVFANYRVGPLGYLAHEEIQKEFGRDGNFGLDDQLTALRWVRKHIAAFGGDPENITLMGQSAGAISIQYMCLNEANRGLFRRALMMSGAGLFPRFALPKPAAETHPYWEAFQEAAGCRSLEELKEMGTADLFAAHERFKQGRKRSGRDLRADRDRGEGGRDLHEDRPPAAREHHHRRADASAGEALRREGERRIPGVSGSKPSPPACFAGTLPRLSRGRTRR